MNLTKNCSSMLSYFYKFRAYSLVLSFLLVLCSQSALAQRGCGTDDLLRQMRKADPLFDQKINHQNADFSRQRQLGSGQRVQTTTYTVPVVVHVVAPVGGNLNYISDQQIRAGIDHMNLAFANQAPYNTATGVNTNIQFCLAQQNAWGAFTSGITRINHQFAVLNKDDATQEQALKNAIVAANTTANKGYNFDARYFVNIFLVPEITGGVAGYAYLPYSNNHGQMAADGIINEAGYFGANFDDSKIHIHEMGHYLGLFHTFEGNCPSGNCPNNANLACPVNNNCDTDGDKICDTPPDKNTAAIPCGSTENSCSTDDDDLDPRNPFRPVANGGIGDQNDKVANHMDYGLHSCHNAFTPNQSARMTQVLTTHRVLLTGPEAKGCLSPCPNPLNVTFNVSSTNVSIPTAVTLTNNTTGTETGYTWAWDFGDGTNSSVRNAPAKSYTNPGNYTIKLTAQNSDVSCTRSFTRDVAVTCPIVPKFTVNGFTTPSSIKINVGETITLVNTAVGSTGVEWLQDGVVIGTGSPFTKTFTASGGYMIQQRVNNGTCKSTSANVFIDVNRCGGSAGKEKYNWVFGMNAGISFNSGSPQPLVSSLQTSEATSVVSTNTGRMLIYTSESAIYDRQGNALAIGIGGTGGTSQVIAFQHPTVSNLIYVFVPAGQVLRYAIINMNLGGTGTDGLPLGQVTTASTQIVAGNGTTERIAAIRSLDGSKIFVVTNIINTNTVQIYTVDQNGLNTTPTTYSRGVAGGDWDGSLKFSPDGKSLAIAKPRNRAIEVYDFNPTTGVVGNVKFQDNTVDADDCHTIEFSPDGSKLYAVKFQGNNALIQFDLNNNFSKTYITTGTTTTRGSMYGIELTPDGRIFISSNNRGFLHVINSPNASGDLCNFAIDAIPLAANTTTGLALTTFVKDAQSTTFMPNIVGPLCVQPNTSSVTYQAGITPQAGETLRWSIANTNPILAEIVGANNQTSVVVRFYDPGSVKLKVELLSPCGNVTDEKSIAIGGAACSGGCPQFTMTLEAPRDLNIIGKEVFDLELNSMNGLPINGFNFTLPLFTNRPFVVESTPLPQTITFQADPNNSGKYLKKTYRIIGRYVTNTYGAFKQDMSVATSDACINTLLPVPNPDMNIFVQGHAVWSAPGVLSCTEYVTGKVFTSKLSFTKAASDVTKIDFQVKVDPAVLEPENIPTLASSFTTYPGYTLSNLSYNSTTGVVAGTITFTVKSDLVATDTDSDPVFTSSNLIGLKLKVKTFPSGGCTSYIQGINTTLTLRSATGTTFTAAMSNHYNSIVYQENSTVSGCGCTWPKWEPCTKNCGGTVYQDETRVKYNWSVNGQNNVTAGTTGSPKVVPDPLTGLNFLVFGNSSTTVTTAVGTNGTGGPGFPGEGSSGKALKFDGIDDAVIVPDYSAINFGLGDYTFEALIRANPIQVGYPQILSKRSSSSASGFLFGLWTNGKPFIQMNDAGNWVCDNCNDLRDSVCHFVAVSRQGGTISYYVDGALIMTKGVGVAGRDMSTTFPLRIGDDANSPTDTRFKGTIEQVRMWNFARPSTQISADYNKPLRGYETGLVAYFKMDEGTGQTVYNSSINYSINGTLGTTANTDAQDPIWQPGSCIKYVLQFNGSSAAPYQYAEVPHYNEINLNTGSFTLEAWIKANSTQLGVPMILSKRTNTSDGFLFGLYNNRPFVQMGGANYNCTSCALITDNSCHQVAVTRQNTTLNFYVDGVLQQTYATGVWNMNSTGNLRIGHDAPSSWNTSFNGTLDEIRIWNSTRSAAEINSNYKIRLTGTESGLVGYWRINEGQGQVIKNSSNYKVNAILGSSDLTYTNDASWVYLGSCSNRNSLREDAVTSVEEADQSQLEVYPNPFDGQIQFILNHADLDQAYDAQLFNSQGILLQAKQNLSAGTMHTWSLSNDLPSGTYLLKVMNKDGKQWSSILVKK